jgi:hypothetical protein
MRSETDLRKIKFCKFFFSFLFFRVKRPDGLSWRLNGGSSVGQTVLITSGLRGSKRPDGKVTCPDVRDQSAYF